MQDNLFSKKLIYPKVQESAQVDDYHGTLVPDPYRALENSQAKSTRSWLKAEKNLTTKFFAGISGRQAIGDHVRRIRNYDSRGTAFTVDGKKYWWLRSAGMSDSILYTGKKKFSTDAKVVFDPNKLSADGSVSMTDFEYGRENRYIAFGTSEGGSDWEEWRVLDVRKGIILADRVRWVQCFGVNWDTKGKGFYYSRYDVADEASTLTDAFQDQKVYYHRLGTDQCHDVLVYEQEGKPHHTFMAQETEKGRYLLIRSCDEISGKTNFVIKDLKKKNADFVDLLADAGIYANCAYSKGAKFWINTTLDAPNGRIIAVDARKPGKVKEILPQRQEVLQEVTITSGRLVASYLKDARSVVMEFTKNGKFLREVPLPGQGCVSSLDGDESKRVIRYEYESFVCASSKYRYNLKCGKTKLVRKCEVKYNPDNYVSEQVFYTSKDGTRIPMFLNYKKGMKRDGNGPTYLYVYGGFSHSVTPSFSTFILTLMDLGFIFAVANLRGGGEYGEKWYQSAIMEHKQNTFDDCIAAGEWLVENNYTCSGKLAVGGASNGGLVVGAVITQRPQLFAAAIADVGLFDMLRFNRFTCGSYWEGEYGNPQIAEQFKFLYAYSPLHRVKSAVAYPATLVMTGDHDDRAVPGHSFKFLAALQKAQAGDAPILLDVQDNAGHQGGATEKAVVDEIVTKAAFLVQVLNVNIALLNK